ncbi:MAG: EF-P lysine aminoacylase GenX [Proteobacteria bacterium]|nr:MAG: EF-P lysine aminoacylase GenX [Pseudomonadota bacterium]
MQWQPQGDQHSRIARAEMLRTIREFFYQRQVLEVETPAVSRAANTDPFIDSFKVVTGSQHRYLHTSPEYAMKRLLVAGSGDIYQICKVWRNEPAARHHNAEFTMLEYYRLGFTLEQLMDEVDRLFQTLLPNLKKGSHYHTYQALFLDNLGIDPHTIADSALQAVLTKHVPEFQGDLTRQAALDLLLTHCIEPKLPTDCLSFISDYPASQSALAETETLPGNPEIRVAKRFEVYVGALELGNGYQELTDPIANEAVLESELNTRQALGLEVVPKDHNLLSAMKSGMPACSGVAIGVDRLLMLATGSSHLSDVLNFGWENA